MIWLLRKQFDCPFWVWLEILIEVWYSSLLFGWLKTPFCVWNGWIPSRILMPKLISLKTDFIINQNLSTNFVVVSKKWERFRTMFYMFLALCFNYIALCKIPILYPVRLNCEKYYFFSSGCALFWFYRAGRSCFYRNPWLGMEGGERSSTRPSSPLPRSPLTFAWKPQRLRLTTVAAGRRGTCGHHRECRPRVSPMPVARVRARPALALVKIYFFN